MEEQVNQLPHEIQLEILTYIPIFKRLSKQYCKDGQLLFNDRHCDKTISKKEFIRYINFISIISKSDIKKDIVLYEYLVL